MPLSRCTDNLILIIWRVCPVHILYGGPRAGGGNTLLGHTVPPATLLLRPAEGQTSPVQSFCETSTAEPCSSVEGGTVLPVLLRCRNMGFYIQAALWRLLRGEESS